MIVASKIIPTGEMFEVKWNFNGEDTTCEIRNWVMNQSVAEATVTRYHKDPACKDKARRFSMQKALKQVFPRSSEMNRKVCNEFFMAYNETAL